MKTITIKLTKVGIKHGPFLITDDFGNTIADNVSRKDLVSGQSYVVADTVNVVTLASKGDCTLSKIFPVGTIIDQDYVDSTITITKTSCMWQHLLNYLIYNTFYGKIEPYIIEYPFAYTYNDEILQNVKDYTRSYKYYTDGRFDINERVEVDGFFNKAVIYNGQQSTGILNLIAKPKHNLSAYSSYPKFYSDSKTILYTKSDNFYQYNTFWSIVKDPMTPLFNKTCKTMSIDKEVNQANMDYSLRSFNKSTIRAKELKIRHILDNRDDLHLVSGFIITPTQISHK